MLSILQMTECCQHALLSEFESITHRHWDVVRTDDFHEIFQHSLRSNIDAAQDAGLHHRLHDDVGHLFVMNSAQNTNQCHDTTASLRAADALLDRAHAPILEDKINSSPVGKFKDLFSPVWMCVVVDGMICPVLFLDILQFLIRRGGDDGPCPSCFCEE